jgi:hypothetical protein
MQINDKIVYIKLGQFRLEKVEKTTNHNYQTATFFTGTEAEII